MRAIGQILEQTSYAAQLADERWHSFVASILRHTKHCECCRRTGVVLQVHHIFYDFRRKLWEYNRDEVSVLCATCHKEIHEELNKFRKYVFRYLNPQSFKTLNGALAVGLTQYEPLVFVHALAEFTGNSRLVENHAKAFGTTSARKEIWHPTQIPT